jgi:hypothetical protein
MFYHPFDVVSLFFIHPFSHPTFLRASLPRFLQVLRTSEVSGIRPVSNHEDLTWEQREPGLQKLAFDIETCVHHHQEEEEEEEEKEYT